MPFEFVWILDLGHVSNEKFLYLLVYEPVAESLLCYRGETVAQRITKPRGLQQNVVF